MRGSLIALVIASLGPAVAHAQEGRAQREPAPGTFTLRAVERRPQRVVTGALTLRRAPAGALEVERAVEGVTWRGRGALAGSALQLQLGPEGAAPVASATYVFTPDGIEVDESLEDIDPAGRPGGRRSEGRAVRTPRPAPGAARRVIVIAGREVPVAADVVTWRDPGGFDAYRRTGFFRPDRALPTSPAPGCEGPERFSARKLEARSLEAVAAHVRQVVMHYDVCWTSRECFRVLHDQRGLSCHFLLDVDGTLYQTLDLADRARHAGVANDRSIGIEIAHPGTLDGAIDRSYREDERGTFLDLGWRAGHVRTPGFVPRPARPAPIRGAIHGVAHAQWDFTAEQYESLGALVAALRGVLPALRLEVPRDAAGAVRMDALSPDELEAFTGILGHWHVTRAKQDPGPAFDWGRVLARAAELQAR